MAKRIEVPPCMAAPEYLTGKLKDRYEELIPHCYFSGRVMSSEGRHLLAKYILTENEYLVATGKLQAALQIGDVADADKWMTLQDKLTRQSLTLSKALGFRD